MSGIVALLKKVTFTQLNFVDKGIGEADESDEVPVLYTDKSTAYVGIPREVHFVTPRLILMPFPSPELIYILAAYLTTHYNKKYMIWNLSEHTYDHTPFNSQVIDYVFVGYPNPPLDMLFATCTSVQAWLDTDPANVAVLHCQASRARSALAAACYLAWSGSETITAAQALGRVCTEIGISDVSLMMPSQKRYLQYSEAIVGGSLVSSTQPVTKVMRLERVILNGIPHMAKEGPCLRPVFQVFKGQNLLYVSSSEYSSLSHTSVPSYFPSDMSVSFDIGVPVDGDILARCRHFHPHGARETVFRCMFHTSFISNSLLRLSKQELDLACDDRRVPSDFQVDFFFSSEERKEGEDQFWRSVEHKKTTVASPDKLTLSPGSASHSDSDEEKIDLALIAKYQKDMEESGGEEDDLTDYLSALESKSAKK